MLKEFRIANYRSINDEQIFTMEACSPREISEFPEHVIEIGDQRLLKVSSLYGPNGSGKTNLFNGLLLLSNIIKGVWTKNEAFGNDNYFPCLLCGDDKPYSKFDIFFVRGHYEIGYSLVVDLRKQRLVQNAAPYFTKVIDTEIICEEFIYRELTSKDFTTLYKRDSDGIVTSDLIKNSDLINSKQPLAKNSTFVGYVFNTFSSDHNDVVYHPIINFLFEIDGIVLLSKESRIFRFTKEETISLQPLLEKTKSLLNGFDIGIKNIYFKEVDGGLYCLFLDRVTADGHEFSIQLNSESSGTRKIVNIILDVLSSQRGSIFIADDFDSHLHPKLIRTIIELFTSKENKNKQLIFNSHDITNMNNQVFRRDEIWFATRSKDDYSTTYIPLSNIVDYKGNMVRKDAVYGKQYLEGKYGADPFIKKGLEWDK